MAVSDWIDEAGYDPEDYCSKCGKYEALCRCYPEEDFAVCKNETMTRQDVLEWQLRRGVQLHSYCPVCFWGTDGKGHRFCCYGCDVGLKPIDQYYIQLSEGV